jgi:hypothetical protein
MGEVYRALDTRLGREVAVKVLPASASRDPERLRRFEGEARAAGSLNHPNLLAVYDVGSHEAAPYLVTELLEGETLRERLRSGGVTLRRAVEHAIGIAHGLAAAHEKGIVHRDLKPENVFVTKDARVKILDFGLAKLRTTPEREPEGSEAPTLSALTGPGVLLGTVGYMSPEQVQGLPADPRSDIFSFGAVLYELLSGRSAFARATSAETLTAILREDPPELSGTSPPVPPGVERLTRRCLEKDPAARFQSARDLAFALDALSSESGVARARAIPLPPRTPWRRRATTLALLAASVAAAFFLGHRTASRSIAEYEMLTARPGLITGARFAPDRSSVLYSGAWGAGPPRVFVRRLDTPEAAPFGLSPASVLSLSAKGEAAILLTRDRVYSYAEGTLARVPLTGGTPRAVLEGVSDADWGPDGESLCVRRSVGGQSRLEFPIGNVLLREWAQFPRVSPDGQRVAFKNQEGELEVVDRAGGRRSLGGRDLYIFGLAWGPRGDEIWFSGSSRGADRALWAVDLAGNRRLLASGAGSLTILDVAADGKALVMTGFGRLGLRVRTPGESEERELATPARSTPVALSSDGRKILIREYLRGGGVDQARLGARGEALLAASDGSSSVRLGPGQALTLSPDDQWALCLQGPPPRLVEVPSGPGEVRVVPFGPLQPDGGWGPARWSPDGRTLFVAAREPAHRRRIFARRDDAGWRAVTPEGTEGDFVVSSDGQRLATTGPSGLVTLYSLEGEPPRELPATLGVTVVHWTEDGQALYVRAPLSAPAVLERLDLRRGRRQPLMELMPDNPDGVGEIQAVLFTRCGRSYAYSYNRCLSDLYLVTGLE